MDRICQYSTIIFASNVSVLLIVSVVTDYWEYRGFEVDKILPSVHPSNTTDLHDPIDTNSYFLIRYYWDPVAKSPALPPFPANVTHYQSPGLVYKYSYQERYKRNVTYFNGVSNVTAETSATRQHRLQDIIVLYVQYGNLYRECDSLETGVRTRLGFTLLNPRRCFNFITSRRPATDYISTELPAVIHLERIAFVFAVVCVVSSVVSVVAGSYGSLAQQKESILTASTAALVSGVSLTVAIALFHGKCHLLHRREFMAGIDVPYKKFIDESRTHHYGWSFVLAWICVVLCFVHTWVWLKKSQDMEARYVSKRTGVHYTHQWNERHDDTAILDL